MIDNIVRKLRKNEKIKIEKRQKRWQNIQRQRITNFMR